MGDRLNAEQEGGRDADALDGVGDLAPPLEPLSLPGREDDPASLSGAIITPPLARDAAGLEADFERLPLEEQDRFLKTQLGTLLTSQQAADAAGVSQVWMEKLAQQGELGTKVGRNYLFTPQEVAAYKEKDRRPGTRPRDISSS